MSSGGKAQVDGLLGTFSIINSYKMFTYYYLYIIIYSFLFYFIHSFIHSFIRSFIHSSKKCMSRTNIILRSGPFSFSTSLFLFWLRANLSRIFYQYIYALCLTCFFLSVYSIIIFQCTPATWK